MVRRSLALAFVFGFVLSAPAFAVERVLVVGDSHTTGNFKTGLLKMLLPTSATGLSTAVYGSCGSSPQHWFGEGKAYKTTCGYYHKDYDDAPPSEPARSGFTPSLPALIHSGKPNYVVIAMGTNQLADPIATSEKRVRKMIEIAKAGGARCMWVGPPQVGSRARGAKNFKAFYAMLEKVTAETDCPLISSRYPRTDARFVERKYFVHYPNKTGTSWGTAVGSEILQKIKYWPKDETTKAVSPYFLQESPTTWQAPAI